MVLSNIKPGTDKVQYTLGRFTSSLNPGHYRTPGSYLTIVHFDRSVEMEKGCSSHRTLRCFAVFIRSLASLAFGQARQMDAIRPVNLSSASHPNQNYESLSFIVVASISVAQLLGSFIAFCYIARSDRLTISTQRLRPNFKQ